MSFVALALAAVCLCGEAPERANDFYWENDCTGFRAYGPGDFHKWSGIDVFNKSTPSNFVVNLLRKRVKVGNWHKNVKGLGMDDYAVGPGRGVGGVALRRKGVWLPDYGNWTTWRIVREQGDMCAFELDYALPIGGTMTLSIALCKGDSLFREAVSFSRDTPLEDVEVGIGLDVNAQREHVGDLVVDADKGLVSLFEKPHNRPGEEGAMMNAICRAVDTPVHLLGGVVDEPTGAKMIMTRPLTKADANGKHVLVVWAGADWSEAGRYRTPGQWHKYVESFRTKRIECASSVVLERGIGRVDYLNVMQQAVMAYGVEHIKEYLASVEKEGVQEHGFPRLTSNLAILIANGYLSEMKPLFVRMMTACCCDAAKGKMPPKSGGNEFSVKELSLALEVLEASKVFDPTQLKFWREALSRIVAQKSYTTAHCPIGDKRAHNWCVFAAASEQARVMRGLGGDSQFVEKWVRDQIRWFDANGMYKDPAQPAVYDFVTRLQFMSILADGYTGASKADLEAHLMRSSEPTLRMLSAAGEIPYGGRSNQFLHNNTFYAADCEWYAARFASQGNLREAMRFRRAAKMAVEGMKGWLAQKPVSHVKNRYVREQGKGVYDARGDMGCERYAYFDKYMITMGSWAALGWRFADETVPALPYEPAVDAFQTTDDFHFVFLRAGDYSAQLDYNADPHYDCEGLGRVQRRGAPGALCLASPCPHKPSYRIEVPNDAPLAIMPVDAQGLPVGVLQICAVRTEGNEACVVARCGGQDWRLMLSEKGLVSTLKGSDTLALALPAFAFDGREATQVAASPHALALTYQGWRCTYETDGEIVDTKRTACNRNGRYRRFEAHARKTLTVKIALEPVCGL